jgi:hypothetical protein
MTDPATKVRPVQHSMFPDLVDDRPLGKILPSVFSGSNADLMAAIAPFYLTGRVVDTTYGEGAWWTKFRPPGLIAHDLHKLDGVSFGDLPESSASVNTVCFDPPYIPAGGVRQKGGGQAPGERAFRNAFGLEPRSRSDIIDLLFLGLPECRRVLAPGGFVLAKCTDYVSGGAFHLGHLDMIRAAEANRLQVHDLIIHHTGSGPGGHNIYDPIRARRHHSYLIVFKASA